MSLDRAGIVSGVMDGAIWEMPGALMQPNIERLDPTIGITLSVSEEGILGKPTGPVVNR